MTRKPPTASSTSSPINNTIRALRDIFMILILRGFDSFWKFNNQLMPNLSLLSLRRGALAWFRVLAAPAFTAEQRIKTPTAAPLRGQVQEDETEQDSRHALVLHGPTAIRCVKLPIRNCH